MVKYYNVVNGVLCCFLAGAMITVSASAVAIPFDIHYEVPEATFGFGAPSFTGLVILILSSCDGIQSRPNEFHNLRRPWKAIAHCQLDVMIRHYMFFLFASFLIIGNTDANDTQPAKPNVLFNSVDDLNDYISPLANHPGIQTPNFERLQSDPSLSRMRIAQLRRVTLHGSRS